MLTRPLYRPLPGRYDSMMSDGTVRPAWSVISRAFGEMRPGELLDRQRHANRLVDAESAGHLVHAWAGDERPWRLDPVQFAIDHHEFQALVEAVTQRAMSLQSVLGDLYGEQRLVRSGVIPAAVLF